MFCVRSVYKKCSYLQSVNFVYYTGILTDTKKRRKKKRKQPEKSEIENIYPYNFLYNIKM